MLETDDNTFPIYINIRVLMAQNRPLLVSIIIAIFIATIFWTQSRMPALGEKAESGDRTNISAIAVDVIFPTDPAQPYVERVIKTSINWAYTNWKGMTFGFLFGATFLSLLQFIPRPTQNSNRFVRSLAGLFLGVPLGVCVNCATPIAYGMFNSGTRLETSLAMLLSSPTLNVIVLSMAFSLLPFHLALLKVVSSIAVIIILVPLLIKLSEQSIKNPESTPDKIPSFTKIDNTLDSSVQCDIPDLKQNWPQAIKTSIQSFWSSLYFIVKHTLLLMIVAGLLGSALIEALPSGDLTSLSLTPLTVFIFASVGTFLPVPIAFDVIVTNALLAAGLPIGLASTLLFSLSIFSIYPALIIARYVSLKLSTLIFTSVIVIAMGIGYVSADLETRLHNNATLAISAELVNSTIHLDIQAALRECDSFKNNESKEGCLNHVQRSEVFANTQSADCDSINAIELGALYPQVIKFCNEIVAFEHNRQLALDQQSLAGCDALEKPEFRSVCIQNYVVRYATTITTIKVCDELSEPNMQKNCRTNLVEGRLSLASVEACQIDLTKKEAIDCYDRMNGRTASTFGKFETCELLSSNVAQAYCKRDVYRHRIHQFNDYAVCLELTNVAMAENCKQMALSSRALQENKPTLCLQLANTWSRNYCQISLKVKNVLTLKQQRHIGDFITADIVEGAKLKAQTEQDNNLPIKPSPLNEKFYSSNEIEISFTEHQARNGQKGTMYRRVSAEELGLSKTWAFNLSDLHEPFKYGKGIASGDFNNDGWPDLVFATEFGAKVFKNNGDGKFAEYALLSPKESSCNAFVVTFVDINDDGWQDIYVSCYGGENYFFKNTQGKYLGELLLGLVSDERILTMSTGFGDIGNDGDLDFVLGNWSYGTEKGFLPLRSQNIWYLNDGVKFIPETKNEILGETLSVLLSDVNNDNNTDVFIANDRQHPDAIYLSDNSGKLVALRSSAGVIAQTSFNNMSYESADFNNDLLLDIFSADMSFSPSEDRSYCDFIVSNTDKQRCEWLLEGISTLKDVNVSWCAKLDVTQKQECFTALLTEISKRGQDDKLCKKISPVFSGKEKFCHNLAEKIETHQVASFEGYLPQQQSNQLLINHPDGHFTNATLEMGVDASFWSWNSKAADLDNDGWQDIYVGNGFDFGVRERGIHSNVFYHNQKGDKFIREEKSFGLTGYGNTPSFTYLDIELDGDIDIVATNVMAPPSIYINQGPTGNSISFELRDYIGNRFCIGCKIIIKYAEKSKHQIRELKLSGGFLSFDNPVVYFGLGEHSIVDNIRVIWSTGEEMELEQEFLGNHRYTIVRKASSAL